MNSTIRPLFAAGLLVSVSGPVFGHNASLVPSEPAVPAPAAIQAAATTTNVPDMRSIARTEFRKADREYRREIRHARATKEGELRRDRINSRYRPTALDVLFARVGTQTFFYGAVVGPGWYGYPYYTAAPYYRPAVVAPQPVYTAGTW